MFSIQVKINYKYKFVVIRNNREIAEFPTKKQARSALLQTEESYKKLNYQQDMFHFTSSLFNGGDMLSIYTKSRNGGEFKDVFKLKRILNGTD